MTTPEISAETRELHKTIDFGFEVEAFLQSNVGKHLVDRAEAEIAEAVEKLKVVDPTDSGAITALQTQIYRAESIQFWMAEAIQSGVNAQREYIERSQGD